MSNDPIVISYDESLLRQSDLALLQGPYWLNDNIISFFFEHLKNTYKKAPFMLFIAPEVTQCIKISPQSQIGLFLEPLNASEKSYIFFALNDNERPQVAGGCHWSLLLFSKPDKAAFHYDSSSGTNGAQAETFARKLFSYFHVKGRFVEERTKQQRNGHDCGIFLICFAELLANLLADEESYQSCGLNEDLVENTRNMRQRIIRIIDKLPKD